MASEDPKEPLQKIPNHVAIIMDGNGRWAGARGLPRLAGHRAGTENLRRVIRACGEFGVKYLTIYAFSTENWDRPPDEVKGLMGIIEEVFEKELAEFHREGVRLIHIGNPDRLSASLQEKLHRGAELTRNNDRFTICIAFNYGGRDELVHACQQIVKEGIPPEEITEAVISCHLYTAGIPDPDLVIRTSGELRLSNFLIWQASYAELYVTPKYWPDFDREELYKALVDYQHRDRRFGKVNQACTE